MAVVFLGRNIDCRPSLVNAGIRAKSNWAGARDLDIKIKDQAPIFIMAAGALTPDGLLDRATMEPVIADGQALSNSKQPARLDEIFDFSLVQRAHVDLKS